MISAIIYDHIHDEMVYISGVVKDIVAINGREKSRINACSSQKALAEIIKEADVEDFVCVDICEKNGTDIAAKLRCRYPGTRIMLIADASISPEQYIVPSIMASALIIRPCTREGIRERLERFVVPMLEKSKEIQTIFLCLRQKRASRRFHTSRFTALNRAGRRFISGSGRKSTVITILWNNWQWNFRKNLCGVTGASL